LEMVGWRVSPVFARFLLPPCARDIGHIQETENSISPKFGKKGTGLSPLHKHSNIL
jgi:hypothetical protein